MWSGGQNICSFFKCDVLAIALLRIKIFLLPCI
jgi:hypothetical protein